MFKNQWFIVGSVIILTQIVLLKNYTQFFNENIIIEGQRCTCPHAKIITGSELLKIITPDSLLKYKFDFTEIYLENEISTNADPMGVKQYVVSGQIVGKCNISVSDSHYYPLFKIATYHNIYAYSIVKWGICVFILLEFMVLFVMFKKRG